MDSSLFTIHAESEKLMGDAGRTPPLLARILRTRLSGVGDPQYLLGMIDEVARKILPFVQLQHGGDTERNKST